MRISCGAVRSAARTRGRPSIRTQLALEDGDKLPLRWRLLISNDDY